MSRSLFRKYRPKLWSMEVGSEAELAPGGTTGRGQRRWAGLTPFRLSQCNKQVGGQTSCFLALPVWSFVLSVKPKTQ